MYLLVPSVSSPPPTWAMAEPRTALSQSLQPLRAWQRQRPLQYPYLIGRIQKLIVAKRKRKRKWKEDPPPRPAGHDEMCHLVTSTFLSESVAPTHTQTHTGTDVRQRRAFFPLHTPALSSVAAGREGPGSAENEKSDILPRGNWS